MVLAASDRLIWEEVQLFAEELQLLADSFAPLLAREIPIAAEALIQRGLLQASPAVYRTRTCFILAITETGRSCVEAWIEQHGNAA
jgi:hypothetical protein